MSDLKNSEQDELLTMLEQMQDEIESLRSENEQLRQTPSSSSEISELKSLLTEVQSESKRKSQKISQQEQTIQQLNAKIESLNNSDLQLREAKRLSQEASTTVSAAEAEAESARQEASKAKRDADAKVRQMKEDLSDREKAATAKEARLNDIEADIEGEVGKRVLDLGTKKLNALEKDYKAKNKALNDKYDKMTAGYKGRYYMALYYGIVVTVLMAVLSEVFRNEVAVFFTTLFDGLCTIGQGLVDLGGLVAKLGDMIPQETVAFIVHWLLQIIVTVGAVAGLMFLIVWGISKFIAFFKEHYADELTVAVMLMALAIIVIGADYVALLPVNLILLYILVFIGYLVVRAFLEWDDAEAKKNLLVNVGLTVGIIVLVWIGLRSIAQSLSELSH